MTPTRPAWLAFPGVTTRPSTETNALQITEMKIPDVRLIVPRRFADERGFFCETYNKSAWREAGIDLEFMQDNQTLSTRRGIVRGLHFQRPPFAQDKLVRVLRGSILDVAVDLRRSSPTFGRHVSAVISAEAFNQILVPVGFAHGFCTLEDDTEVLYKVTNRYAPDHDCGVRWDDPDLGIEWPIEPVEAILSPKDAALPRLSELTDLFD